MKTFYVGSANSEKYQLDKDGISNIGKVIFWSCAATFIATIITLLPQVPISAGWLWIVPLANTALIAVKEYIEDKR